MDNEEKKYREALQQIERNLMPRIFTDPKTLITKYGSDIADDFTFMILTASILMKHEKNTYIDNLYDDDLHPILDKSLELEKTKYGLKDDEYFSNSERPDDVKQLDDEFAKILDDKLIQLFRTYKLNEFANSYSKDKDKFMARFYAIKDRLKGKKGDAILSIIQALEIEAIKCANIQAYNAAAILIASAIEGVLYRVCSGNTAFIKELIVYNKMKNRKKSAAELSFSELINLASNAGLLPTSSVPEISDLLRIVNSIRNLIHPGRRLSADYHNVNESEYSFLYEVFMGLKNTYGLNK